MKILDFEGTLCGNYAVISDFQIKSSAANYDHGLFGRQGGTVRCLYLKEFTIKGKRNIGAFAGTNTGTIEYCSAVGDIDVSRSFTDTDGGTTVTCGEIAGYNSGVISNCSFDGNVNAKANSQYMYVRVNAYCGGILGSNAGTIEDSYSVASVTATTHGSNTTVGCYSYAGGICASLSGSVKNSFVGGNVQVVVDVYQYGRDFGVNIGGAYAVRYSGATVENTYVLEGQKLSGVYINDAGTIVTVDPAPTLTLSEIEEMLGKSFPIQ